MVDFFKKTRFDINGNVIYMHKDRYEQLLSLEEIVEELKEENENSREVIDYILGL